MQSLGHGNGLGEMTTEWQAHGGAVNTSTSPKVQYAYSEMSGGANHSRLTSITYPSGYVLTFNYSSGLNNSCTVETNSERRDVSPPVLGASPAGSRRAAR